MKVVGWQDESKTNGRTRTRNLLKSMLDPLQDYRLKTKEN